MKIHWKLNLLVTGLIAVFLLSVGVVLQAAQRDVEVTAAYAQSREQAQFTADVRANLYLHLAAEAGAVTLPPGIQRSDWPRYVLEDISVQIHLSDGEDERREWQGVYQAVAALGSLHGEGVTEDLDAAYQSAVRSLRAVRDRYDLSQAHLLAEMARNHLRSHVAVWAATVLTILLFLVHLIMVRHWLVSRIAGLKSWVDRFARGGGEPPVPLEGRDELAELGRHMREMTSRLARQQAALIEARELSAIGEVCGNIAHGLRNPLAAMRVTAQLAQRRVAGQPEIEKALEELIRQSDRMDDRITKMFEFATSVGLHCGPAAFSELARLARTEAQPLMQARSVSLVVEDVTGEQHWSLDAAQISTVLAELITNAVHHSPQGSAVVLRGEVLPSANGKGRCLRLSVIDRGGGMPAAVVAKAFDMFFTSRPDGTGMGLAFALRVVRKHGGDIQITSEPRVGTTVLVTLPEPLPRSRGLFAPA
jgi:signal transduction histidine kinase